MNEGCSGIEKNSILKPEHPLCSSSSDVMPNIAVPTFSFEGTSNSSKTRYMRESVSINTVTTKENEEVISSDIGVAKTFQHFFGSIVKFKYKKSRNTSF